MGRIGVYIYKKGKGAGILDTIGNSIPRKESWDKVAGTLRFVRDRKEPGLLHAWVLNSPLASASIAAIDLSAALRVPGVRAIVTGRDEPRLTGPIIADRPMLAIDRVRYFGEAVAIVVADRPYQAKRAAERIQIRYEKLPVVHSPTEAFAPGAPLLHERLGEYTRIGEVHPVPGTNIANHVKIRKGNAAAGFAESEIVVEETYAFNTSDHAAMEQRCAQAEVSPDGQVVIHTCSQGPFVVKELVSRYFGIEAGKVVVHVPPVGGAFGGKGSVQLEYLAVLASRAVGGRPVRVANTRGQDIVMSPCHIGLEAKVKLGCKRDGTITAAQITYWFDGGAYSDMACIIAKAAACDSSGPYRIPHLHVDSYCMYTNHPYSTAFRGYGHPELTFVLERTMDMMAKRLGMDPLEFRFRNAIGPGDTSPTQEPLSASEVGNIRECIRRLRQELRQRAAEPAASPPLVRTVGVGCFWKTASSPPDASAGAVVTFNPDGSLNLNVGAVEIGQGSKTTLAMIAAERLRIPVDQVHVTMDVITKYDPHHWKTVASSTTFLVGRAVLEAVDDAIRQLRELAAEVLRVPPEDLEVAQGRVFRRGDPQTAIPVKDLGLGYKYPNGNAIGGPVIGRGNYIMPRLSHLDPETGKGRPGPWWTVGAQAVEVEFDPRDCSYRLIRAYSVIDAGRVLNPQAARGQVMGGVTMGLSFAGRETFQYDNEGIVLDPNWRTYKILPFGEQPDHWIDFVETPLLDGPYGARGIGEMGLIGIPGALANALSLAAGTELNFLPLWPEAIWRARGGSGA
jgi:CO/xanthine dehydrogenase Mo-binding subunit